MGEVAERATASFAERIIEAVEQDKVVLPPLPELTMKLQELLSDEDKADARKVTELVHNEPAVAAAILRCANSAAFGGLRPISDLNQAVARLGMKRVHSLVTALQLKDQFNHDSPERTATLKQLWDHSVATAMFSKHLAERDGQASEDAFLAGLLHDCGRLLVFRSVDYLTLNDKTLVVTGPVLNELMESLHCTLGHHVLQAWHLPEDICTVALHHEDPVGPDDVMVLTIVQAADLLARKMGFHLDPDPALDLLEEPAIERLALKDIEMATLMIDLEDEFNQVREMF